MTPRARKRLFEIVGVASLVGIFSYVLLDALKENMMYFLTPSSLAQSQGISGTKTLRLGGVVKEHSIGRHNNKRWNHGGVLFVLTDGHKEVKVVHCGYVPALFREGQGVIVEGAFDAEQKIFRSQRLLAKHDETYRIPQSKDQTSFKVALR